MSTRGSRVRTWRTFWDGRGSKSVYGSRRGCDVDHWSPREVETSEVTLSLWGEGWRGPKEDEEEEEVGDGTHYSNDG